MEASTALVVGAGSGIGLATASKLAEAGWQVAGIDRNAVSGGPCHAFRTADVLDEDAARAAVRELVADLGGLTSLIYCAGISGSAVGDGPVVDATGPTFDQVIGTNLRGAVIVTSQAWPALVANRGNIVLISSILGVTGGGGPFRSTAYITSKGGLVTLTRTLAAEGRTAGVRVNCVAPGVVDTPFARRTSADAGVARYVQHRQPLTDGQIPVDAVADVVQFFCSPAAAAVTGQVLAADAGWGLDPAS